MWGLTVPQMSLRSIRATPFLHRPPRNSTWHRSSGIPMMRHL